MIFLEEKPLERARIDFYFASRYFYRFNKDFLVTKFCQTIKSGEALKIDE